MTSALERPARLILSLCATLSALTLTSLRASAQDDRSDALVTPYAPTRHGALFTLSQGEALQLADVELVPAPREAQVVRDVKVLPDGAFLLTGPDQGVVRSDPREGLWQRLMTPLDMFATIESASVSAYDSLGRPSQLLITDSQPTIVSLWDVGSQAYTWRRNLFVPGARGFFAQGIVLPEDEVAIATSWRSLGLYGIDLIDARDPARQGPHRIANLAHAGAPDALTLMGELDELRELMALDAQHLLVTTRLALFVMRRDGEIVWRVDVGDAVGLTGELASARALPSGLIVAATFAPGFWTQAHPDHRVAWIAPPSADSPQPSLVARSGALPWAPRRVEAREGTGASGTLDYVPGQLATQPGELEDLSLTGPPQLTPEVSVPGALVRARFTLRNDSEGELGPLRVALLARAGEGCDPAQPAQLVVELADVRVGAEADYSFDAQGRLGVAFGPGRWCAQAAVRRSEDTAWRVLSPSASFEIAQPGQSTITVPTQDLGLERGEPDMGGDTDMSESDEEMGPGRASGADEGCACALPGGRTRAPSALLWLVMLSAFGARQGASWKRRSMARPKATSS